MGRPRCTLITPLVSSPKSGVYPHCGVPTTNFDCAHRRRPPVSLHARTLTHTPALKLPHPYSAAPRPVMVSPTPLSSNVARNRALATVSAKRGDPGRATGESTGTAVAGRRLASRRAVRPSRAALATVAASPPPWPSAVRRFESIGRTPRFGAGAPRRGGGSWGGPAFAPRRPDELRVALRAHGLTAPPPRSELPPTSSRAGSKTSKPHKNHKKS